ncbi:hypothetical protein PsYK624_035220 [Phanerochaete sordida]|uniref:F-box domain-containing protein n=1 Tax=Phanerochaete sordida TaxID=48140 RepID=A0A9P3G4I5_9APHY|nr:hypothetical protein PsYK624_035220 [Phanerochaete sordida]
MRLPNELLGEIFLVYSDGWFFSPADEQSSGTYYGWVRITHVCFHWRVVALNTALLWSIIPVHTFDSTVAFLQRSEETRLHVSGTMSIKNKDRLLAWSRIFTSSARITTLEIVTHEAKDTLAASIHLRATHNGFGSLRRLALRGCDDGPWLDHHKAPETQLGDIFPLLALLEVKNFPWPVAQRFISASSSLRALQIDCSAFRSAGWQTVLDTLANLVSLRHLSIIDSTPLDNDPPPVPDSPVSRRIVVLPSLCGLWIALGDSGKESAFLLACLHFPARAVLGVTCLADPDSVQSVSGLSLFTEEIVQKLCSKPAVGPALPMRTMVIRQDLAEEEEQLNVQLYSLPALVFNPEGATTDDVLDIPAGITLDMQGFSDDDVVRQLASFPSSSLVSLAIGGPISVTAHSIRLGVGHLSNISTLCISSTAVYPVLQALTPCLSYPRVLFPALKTLHVNCITLLGPKCTCSHFEVLRTALERRAKLNTRLNDLLISGSYSVYEKELEVLRAHVGEIVWDGLDLD